LLGKNGQVGWELQRTLAPLGQVIALGRKELDLVESAAIRSTVRAVKPDLIINAASYTAVDKAEKEDELALAVNAAAPGVLAEEAKLCRAALVHYSTDYVFDGTKATPYTEDDAPNPVNTYGQTKLEGDRLIQETEVPHLIFRTGWVYGLRGSNFLLTILRLAREKEELSVVKDQIGAPTWSRMIAEATAQVLSKGALDSWSFLSKHRGIYNLTASGRTSWYHFAERILQLAARDEIKCQKINAITSGEYKTPARRPLFSVLDNSRLFKQFGLKLPSWDSSLTECLKEISFYC